MISIKQYIIITAVYGVAMAVIADADGILQPIEGVKMLITSTIYIGTLWVGR